MDKTDEDEIYERPTCEMCGRRNLRFRIDGSYFCKRCGYDSKKQGS